MAYGPPPAPPPNPYGEPVPPPVMHPGGAADPGAGARRVKGPAIGVIVTGTIGLVMSLLSLPLRGAMLRWYADMLEGMQQGEAAEQLRTMIDKPGPFDYIGIVVGVLVGALTIAGGVAMLRLRSWGFALTGAILAALPCMSGCCCIGLPIGIWALIVLLDKDVKTAFEQAARG